MRRTSFRVAMSITLTDALSELTTKAMPAAQPAVGSKRVAKLRENKRKRRRMAWNSPAGMAAFPTLQVRNRARLIGPRPSEHRGGKCEHDAGWGGDQHVVGER